MNILTILGTRPEAVKMAPVISALSEEEGVRCWVCTTAQHREMLDQVLDLFEIQPDFDLDVMRPDQSLGDLSAAIFKGLDPVIADLRPDWVLVQGDTTTAMIAGILSYYHRTKVGHVEAGLRTNDKWQPFPEEVNRRVVTAVADLHFAPTEWANANLLQEGIPPEQIAITGNTVVDALLEISSRPYDFSDGPLAGIPEDRKLILVTAHRRENFGKPMERIFTALRKIAADYSKDVHLIYPVHLNPNVHEPAYAQLGDIPNMTLLPPLDYLSMVHLMKKADLILTDSGGLQEEAPSFHTPVLVLREVTERPEAIEAGTALLVGTDTDRIVSEVHRLMDDPQVYSEFETAINPFGDGRAAHRIVDSLLAFSKSSSIG